MFDNLPDACDLRADEVALHGYYPHLTRYHDGTWGCRLQNSKLGIWPYETGRTAELAIQNAFARAKQIEFNRCNALTPKSTALKTASPAQAGPG